MKAYITIILIIIYSATSFGQKENKYSIGADANYLYYFSADDKTQDFNYEANLFISKNIAKVKVSLGVGYSTFNFHDEFDSSDNVADGLYKEKYKAQYLNVPLLVYFNNRLDRKYNFSPYMGMIFNRVIDYDRISYFTDKSPEKVDGIEAGRNTGLTLRIGTNVSRVIKRNVVLSTALFADYKAVPNHFFYLGRFDQPEGRLTFGLKIGIDYLL